jgi:extracellular factor (EF) 3-hydroxypalmitic acid methyl ester biosynthesis protein
MALSSGEKDTFIVCCNSQGAEVRATLLRLTRSLVVFEAYNPYSILQLSEVLSDFKIIMNERVVYSGRAVVSNLVNTGIMLVCEATLDESWLEIDLFSTANQREKLRADFAEFAKEWGKIYAVLPEFKVVVADMQTLFAGLRRWLEQVELGVCSQPADDRAQVEREVLLELQEPIGLEVTPLLERFEEAAQSVESELQPVHKTYLKRQIHPLVLCSPFIYRTFQKPLGYAGDYEMVNMMLRDPYEGSSMFAKMLNKIFLYTAPVVAHRNRIVYLTQQLIDETSRVARQGRVARIYNLGCGPAGEVQNFLVQHDLCEQCRLTLVDFNEETLHYTGKLLEDIKVSHRRTTPIQMVKKSVHQLLKDAAKRSEGAPQYDFIYCAGLFDYLSDRICSRLISIFYDMLAPGGLLVVTNVDNSNPSRKWMEYVLEWHLVYRNKAQLESLAPEEPSLKSVSVNSDPTGVNIFLEVRRSEDA